MTEFAGRRVIVVGATGALGTALCSAFIDAGAHVYGFDRTAPAQPNARVEHLAVDVLSDTAVAAAFDALPPPWAVVNTVGGFAGFARLVDLDPAELAQQLQLNLTTAALITKHALRRMSETGQGRLVHTASRAAVRTEGQGFPYSVSKLAVLHLVEMAASEVRGTGITVNAVVPSIIDTPANRAAMPTADHESWPKPLDVARVYVFLASPAAHLISGAAVPV